MRIRWFGPGCAIAIGFMLAAPSWAQAPNIGVVVNDVTQLNPIVVERVITPHSIQEIQQAVRSQSGPISVGGGRYSMGGQTATEGALQIDMRQFDKVVSFSPEEKTITVEPGITWRKIQAVIDPLDLSLKIMQTYSNFTVGGSLSVNVHGRYIGQGPVVRSVRSIKLVLADGSLVECSPTQNSEIFFGAIGGYGGMGVIVEATLELADDVKVERRTRKMPITEYRKFFAEYVRDDKDIVFHNGDIYPPGFDTVSSVSWYRTEKPLTIEDRLRPEHAEYRWQARIIGWLTSLSFGREWLREHLLDPWVYRDEVVVWRNHEASYDVAELEPASRKDSTYVLQEYFIPVGRFDDFVPKMAAVFKKYRSTFPFATRCQIPAPCWPGHAARSFPSSSTIGRERATRSEPRSASGRGR
jgi:FAD/FMN-containing dehydrogenase